MYLQLTPQQLKVYLQNINKLSFFGMEMVTQKKMNDYLDYYLIDGNGKKTKNPNPTRNPFTDGIYSHSRMFRLICGFDYKKTVERRRKRKGLEPSFQTPSDRKPWFRHVSNCVVEHIDDPNKSYFMYLRCHRSMIEHEYLYQGNPIEKQLFEDYLTKSNNKYGNQGLGNDSVPVEVVSLENIRFMGINGDQIEVIQPVQVQVQVQQQQVIV